ncbi:MAG: ABC transporter substrate-binding protein [Cyanobacteria bacterium]|nr:ABC transporter substrate-binding protein [Cyanobacteriota bacterium]
MARRRALLGSLLGLVLLTSGCSTQWQPPENFNLLLSAGLGEDRIARANLERLAQELANEFMRVNPRVNVHLRLTSESEVLSLMRSRSGLGAAPDLLITRVPAAYALAQERLTTTSSLEPAKLDPLRIKFLGRFRQGNRFRALPLLVQPTVACYNRKRVPAPPRTLEQLVSQANGGQKMGLPLELRELLWTATGFGAQQPLFQLLEVRSRIHSTEPLKGTARQLVLAWLEWLYRANVEPNVIFVDTADELVARLEKGQLDWISCNATTITRLQRSLGSNLAVADLPRGPDGAPSRPFARMLVMSFGRDSTPGQREAAEKFALFVLNEYTQSKMVAKAVGNMPVNQNVVVPVKDAAYLPVIERSLDHSIIPSFYEGMRITTLANTLRPILKQTIYGEQKPEQVLKAIEAIANGPNADVVPVSGGPNQ